MGIVKIIQKNLSQIFLSPYLHGIGINSTSKTQVYVPNSNFHLEFTH